MSPRGYGGRRGYSSGPSYYGRGFITPRSYARSVYRGYYDRGFCLGYGVPYAYPYDPGYVYDPGYAVRSYGPAPAPQACADGSYDRYGTWVPDPNCYSDQQQYQPRQSYDPNQPQRYNR